MVVCCCDGSVDGILTAVFEAWSADIRTSRIQVPGESNIEWFAEYVQVDSDAGKASRVARKVISAMGSDAFEMIYMAAITEAADRGDAILQFIRKGLRVGPGIVDDLQDRYVMRVFELRRMAWREYQHYRGFLRFRQQGDYLLAKIEPKNDLTTVLLQFFADRLSKENFVIADMTRAKAGVHKRDGGYYIADIDTEAVRALECSRTEQDISELWDIFTKSIAIESRYNPGLQRQNMPLRFRKYMDTSK